MKHLYLSLATLAAIIILSANANAQVQYEDCTVSREYASAIGKSNHAGGICSFAAGTLSSANGNYSYTLGYNSNANGTLSAVIGHASTANADGSTCIGQYIVNDATGSIIIGSGRAQQAPLTLDGYKDRSYVALGARSTIPTLMITEGGNGRTGDVYIGRVINSEAKLHIHSDLCDDCSVMLTTESENKPTVIYFRNTDNGIRVDQSNAMSFSASSYSFTTGKVGIGCENTAAEFALAVKGGILTDDVLIRSQQQWPDYVFGKDYNLMSLPELKRYISENRHLPDMPSETEVAGDGVSVGEMQALLLRKVEELTLYTIQQQEMIERLHEQCEHQQKMIDELIGK